MSDTSVTLKIDGMMCDGCVNTVSKVLGQVPGVAATKVDLEAGTAVVTGNVASESLIEAVEAAGYDAALG